MKKLQSIGSLVGVTTALLLACEGDPNLEAWMANANAQMQTAAACARSEWTFENGSAEGLTPFAGSTFASVDAPHGGVKALAISFAKDATGTTGSGLIIETCPIIATAGKNLTAWVYPEVDVSFDPLLGGLFKGPSKQEYFSKVLTRNVWNEVNFKVPFDSMLVGFGVSSSDPLGGRVLVDDISIR